MNIICTPKHHWGMHLWGFIHTITIVDFDHCKVANETIKELLTNFKNCIPCSKCNSTYDVYLQKINELDLSKRMILFYWSVDLHNAVNKKLGKQEWTIEMAKNKWCNAI